MKNPFKAIRELQAEVTRLNERVFELEHGQPLAPVGVEPYKPLDPAAAVREVLREYEEGPEPWPSQQRLALKIAGMGNVGHLPDRNTTIATLRRFLEDHGPRPVG